MSDTFGLSDNNPALGIDAQIGVRFDYPSLVQGADGSLHATCSYNLKTIKCVTFNEAWVRK